MLSGLHESLPCLALLCEAAPVLDSLLVPAKEKDSRWSMVVLHGLGDSIAGYRWLPDALDLPWLNHLLVNAPDHYFGGFSWYDFAGNPGPGVERSFRMLVELLDEHRDRGFPSEQTFLFGFSQGSLMAIEVGLRYRHRLAGCIGISGYVHDPERLLRQRPPAAQPLPILMTHGTYDPLIPIAPVRLQIQQLRAAGVPITWHEFAKDHTIAGEEELAVIRKFLEARKVGNG